MQTIPLTTVLDMYSNDLWIYVHCSRCYDVTEAYLGSNACRDCGMPGTNPHRVYEILDVKRRDPGYSLLRENIKRNGFHAPVLLSLEENTFFNGHHRLAVAEDLGIDYIPYTENQADGWADSWPLPHETQEYFDEHRVLYA